MDHDIKNEKNPVNMCNSERTCCAGGVPKQQQTASEKTIWYVAIVRKHNQLVARDMLNRMASSLDYPLEGYVASQRELRTYANRHHRMVEQIVIPGKLFIRVPEKHRLDVLRMCSLISHYQMDPASRNSQGGRDFAKVPEREMTVLRTILEKAEGPVVYSEEAPRKGDTIQVLTGQFHGLYGKVYEDSGKTHVVVVLDSLGSFTFRMPISDIAKV